MSSGLVDCRLCDLVVQQLLGLGSLCIRFVRVLVGRVAGFVSVVAVEGLAGRVRVGSVRRFRLDLLRSRAGSAW